MYFRYYLLIGIRICTLMTALCVYWSRCHRTHQSYVFQLIPPSGIWCIYFRLDCNRHDIGFIFYFWHNFTFCYCCGADPYFCCFWIFGFNSLASFFSGQIRVAFGIHLTLFACLDRWKIARNGWISRKIFNILNKQWLVFWINKIILNK